MLHFTKGPHLGLDALEEIISRQRHSNASCGLEESHEGDSIASLAFALSHRCLFYYNLTITDDVKARSTRLSWLALMNVTHHVQY